LKKWSPAQLGEALDKSARWVQAMEHDNTVPESISRRRALATILGIPPILLGLASIENGAATPEHKINTEAPRKLSIDTATLSQYNEILHLYWELDYNGTAQESIKDIEHWIRHLRSIAPEARGNQQLVD
jgi:transcriptional regulator with XRE-family HTH domain